MLLFCLLFFHRLGDRELTSSHEARAAQNAAVMLERGDWGLPRLFDGSVELQKPPLYYWLVRAGCARCAAGWTPGRCGCRRRCRRSGACCCSVHPVRHGRGACGFVAACMLATLLHFTWLGRVGRIDMPSDT